MKQEFTKFNILIESTKNDLLLEKKKGGFFSKFKQEWTLEEELEGILPYISKKLGYAFGNFYELGQPGELDLTNMKPDIVPIGEGSSTPGFQITWNLYEAYVEENVLPCLLKNPKSPFVRLNKKYDFLAHANKLDPQLVLRLYVKDNNPDLDFSKQNVLVKKFSVDRWEGDVYLNLNCEGMDKDKSNVNIGDVNVYVKLSKYDSWTMRLINQINHGGETRANEPGLMDELKELLGGSKKNRSALDIIKVPSSLGKTIKAQIKVLVTFNKTIKKPIELSDKEDDFDFDLDKIKHNQKKSVNSNKLDTDSSEYINEKLIKQLELNFDKIKFLFSEKDIKKQLPEKIKEQNGWNIKGDGAIGDILLMFNQPKYIKNYRIILDLLNWRRHDHDIKYLTNDNTKILIIFSDFSGKKFYEKSYTIDELKEVEPEAYKYIKNLLKNLKDE